MRSKLVTALLAVHSFCGITAAIAAGPSAPPISAYGALPALEIVALSPGGRIAMLTTTGGKRVIVLTDANLKPTNIVQAGDIKVRSLRWAGDEMLLVTRSDTQELGERFVTRNAEFSNVMIVPANPADEISTVFSNEKTILNATYGSYGIRKVDGRWVGFFGGLPMTMGQTGQYFYDGQAMSLYMVDLASNKAERVASGFSHELSHDWLINTDGKIAAHIEMVDKSGAWTLTNAGGKRLASGVEKDGSASILSFGVTGETLIYGIYPDEGENRYFEVPLDGSASSTLRWTGDEIETFYFDPYSSRLQGVEYEDEDKGYEFLLAEAKSKILPVVASFDKVGGEVVNFTPDYSRVLVFTSGNNDSGTYLLADTIKKNANVLGKSRPLINGMQVGPISYVSYEASDGTAIQGVLTLPPGREASNLPLIMLPHGGPRAHDTDTFDWWAQAFASRGYAVFQPNFRGSTGYGLDFMHAGDGEWGKKMQTDLDDGIAHLAKDGLIDPKRACIVGASYGGYAALAGVTLQQGRYKCAVAVAPVSDLQNFFEREYAQSGQASEMRKGWLEMMGPRDQLGNISPRKFAGRADAPILLIHGRDDTVVPFDQSKIMASALKSAGKPYQMVELDGEDHWLSRSETREKMLNSAVEFVQRYNPVD